MAGQNEMAEFAPDLSQFLKKINVPHKPMPPVGWTEDK
jgi:hypothetical protein